MLRQKQFLLVVIALLAGCRTTEELTDFEYYLTIANVKEEDVPIVESVLRQFDENVTLDYERSSPLADLPDEIAQSNLAFIGAAKNASYAPEVLTEGTASARVRLTNLDQINALYDELTALADPKLELEHSAARIEQGYYTGEAKGRGFVLVYGNVSNAASTLIDTDTLERSLTVEGEEIELNPNGSFAFWYLFRSGRSRAKGKLTVGRLKYDVRIGSDGRVTID